MIITENKYVIQAVRHFAEAGILDRDYPVLRAIQYSLQNKISITHRYNTPIPTIQKATLSKLIVTRRNLTSTEIGCTKRLFFKHKCLYYNPTIIIKISLLTFLIIS